VREIGTFGIDHLPKAPRRAKSPFPSVVATPTRTAEMALRFGPASIRRLPRPRASSTVTGTFSALELTRLLRP